MLEVVQGRVRAFARAVAHTHSHAHAHGHDCLWCRKLVQYMAVSCRRGLGVVFIIFIIIITIIITIIIIIVIIVVVIVSSLPSLSSPRPKPTSGHLQVHARNRKRARK